jgi:hypothetical protein
VALITSKFNRGPRVDKPAVYRIKVKGVLPDSWSDRIGGLQIVEDDEDSVTLEGWLHDQAALSMVFFEPLHPIGHSDFSKFNHLSDLF